MCIFLKCIASSEKLGFYNFITREFYGSNLIIKKINTMLPMLCDCGQNIAFQLLHLIKCLVFTLWYLSALKFTISRTNNLVLFYSQEFFQHASNHVIRAAPCSKHTVHRLVEKLWKTRTMIVRIANVKQLKHEKKKKSPCFSTSRKSQVIHSDVSSKRT